MIRLVPLQEKDETGESSLSFHPLTGEKPWPWEGTMRKQPSIYKPRREVSPGDQPAGTLMLCFQFPESESVSHSAVSSSLRPHGLHPSKLLCPWNSPGKNTGVGCHSLLEGIFPTQGIIPKSPMLQADSLPSEASI